MKLENQVCSLELSKQLKELGVKQESLCIWILSGSDESRLFLQPEGNYREGYSAFTVAELGEMLPILVKTERKSDCFMCYGEFDTKTFAKKAFMERTEADARAKMLIYLLEHGLVKADGEKSK